MKILVAAANKASFIERDIRILSERNKVAHFIAKGIGFGDSFRHFGKLRKADTVLLWFASPRFILLTLLARLLGKRVGAIIGGYEAASLPEFEYGSARNWLTAIPTKILLKLCHGISVVSESSRNSAMKNLRLPSTRLRRIYHGFDDILKSNAPTKERQVVTVGTIDRFTWRIKGMREFFLVAEHLPDASFIHIGNVSLDIRSMLGREPAANVEFVGAVPYEEISSHLSNACVYLQLSYHESFACAVTEAMLCECIPVVSDAYALPEVVGQTGIVLHDRNPERTASAIRAILDNPGTMGKAARKRIVERFTSAKRRDELEAWLAQL